jgi:AcrR family transcriptional regulator
MSMGSPRGDAEQTKAQIVAAARTLFAERGIAAVTVRDIAKAAGVTHGLVHHYFGSKERMATEIIRRETGALAEAIAAMPVDDPGQPLDVLRRLVQYYLTEGRTSLLLITRAELDGLDPESMFDEGTLSPLQLLAAWLGAQPTSQSGATRLDPALVSAYIGAAAFALATMSPFFMKAVGLTVEDYERRADEIVDIAVSLARLATGATPEEI